MNKLKLLEKKLLVQEEYSQALETNNTFKASYLRGKLALIDELLKETKEVE